MPKTLEEQAHSAVCRADGYYAQFAIDVQIKVETLCRKIRN
ncbi:hypothetical protein [Nostoc sp.]